MIAGIPSSLCEGVCVQGPGAAGRDQREVAWVMAALDRDEPHRLHHRRVRDLDDPHGRCWDVDPERLRALRR